MTHQASPQATVDMHITGTLARDAELRNRVLDSAGHNVPVICLDLVAIGPAHMPVHVEWPQAQDGHSAAERLAKSLKRGMTVTVQSPLVGMRLVAANASAVHASAPDTTNNDLFAGT
jgi:hypothetical protein